MFPVEIMHLLLYDSLSSTFFSSFKKTQNALFLLLAFSFCLVLLYQKEGRKCGSGSCSDVTSLPVTLDVRACSYCLEDSAHSGSHFYKQSINQRCPPNPLKLLSKLVNATQTT